MNQSTKNAYKFPWEHCFDKSLVKDIKEKKYRGYKPAHLLKSKAERTTKKTAVVEGKSEKKLVLLPGGKQYLCGRQAYNYAISFTGLNGFSCTCNISH